MLSQNEIRRVYDKELENDLRKLEQWRKKRIGHICLFFIGVVAISAGLCVAAYLWSLILLYFFPAILIVLFLIYWGNSVESFSLMFRKKVLPEMTKLCLPGSDYAAAACIGQELLDESCLFDIFRIGEVKGNDYLAGEINGKRFECSWVHARSMVNSNDSGGLSYPKKRTFYIGLFMVFDFPVSDSSITVLPNSFFNEYCSWYMKRAGGPDKKNLQQIQYQGPLKFDDQEFNKCFVTYVENQNDASQNGLDQNLRKKLVELHGEVRKINRKFNLFCAFCNNKVYIGINNVFWTYFHPEFRKSVLNNSFLSRFNSLLGLIEKISRIRELDKDNTP